MTASKTRTLSEGSLSEWMGRLGPSLLALSVGICRDRHQAEEIVQEAFVRLWRTPPDAGEVAFSAWLRRVVTNLSINCLKRTRRPSELPEFGDDPALRHRDLTPPELVEMSDRQALLEQALARLDEPKRAILMLRGAEQLGYEAIARTLDVPIGTVMSRLNRARAALLEQMGRLEGRDATDDARASDTFPIRHYRSA